MYGFPPLHCGYSLMFPSAVKLLSLSFKLIYSLLFGFVMLELALFKPHLCFSSWLRVGLCHRGLSEGDGEAGGRKKGLAPACCFLDVTCESCSRFLHPTWQQCLPAKATWQFSTTYKSSLMMPHFWCASNQPSGDPSSGIWVPGPRSPPLSSWMLIIATSSFCSFKP